MEEKPKVSVVIPTHDRNRKLLRAVKSVEKQTYENIQIIVVNDSTNNELPEYVRNSSKIISIRNKRQRGGAGARNTGINIAEGRFIAFLDDDDFFHPKKIEKQVQFMKNHGDDDFFGCFTWYKYYESEKDLKHDRGEIIREDAAQIIYRMLRGQEVRIGGCSSLIIKNKSLQELGGFNEEFSRHQDWELLIRLLRHGDILCLDETLFSKIGYSSPEPVELCNSKEILLEKFEDEIESFNAKKRRRIFIDNYEKISKEFFKDKRYLKGLYYFLKASKNIRRPEELPINCFLPIKRRFVG